MPVIENCKPLRQNLKTLGISAISATVELNYISRTPIDDTYFGY